ncbi:hypothetical protein QWZ06_10760 [Chryseobacterium tructae]|uniref:O-antigen polymerase n=1 Tax=Chryseobacterium tructae TaxID=1037380 RepID=A0ABV7XYT0_9FLAO|nr:hypothetical protein [Chryseobacterium tructae]MDN3692727.1 hypothetical protein [Chryseobacterium tructae]
MQKTMNYVTLTYLLNLFIYSVYFFSKEGSEVDFSKVEYMLSGTLALFLIGAGYLNAKKRMTYRSVLWVFFVNILLFSLSGVFDQFGNNFNLFATGSGDSFLFTLVLIVYNGYLFPLIAELEKSGFSLVLPVLLSFVLPSLGYIIGMKLHPNKKASAEM